MNSIKRFWILIFITVGLGLFLFFRFDILGFSVQSRTFSGSFFDRSFNYKEFKRLEVENAILRGEIDRLRKNKNAVIFDETGGRKVKVYSNYPFNDKSFMVIDYGREDGAELGMPIVSKNILVGGISEIKNKASTVKTIFDSSWVGGVVVGGDGTKAVLKGGLPPRLELLPQEFKIQKGDIVYNTSPSFPLNIPVAVVQEAEKGSGKFWNRVVVKPLFQRDEITEVSVLFNFP